MTALAKRQYRLYAPVFLVCGVLSLIIAAPFNGMLLLAILIGVAAATDTMITTRRNQ